MTAQRLLATVLGTVMAMSAGFGAGFTLNFSTAAAEDTVPAVAQSKTPAAKGSDDKLTVPIVMVREQREVPLPLSLLDLPPKDDGVAGGQLAVNDNNTTGRFLNQEFSFEVIENAKADHLAADVVARAEKGAKFFVVDASGATLLALADALKGKQAVLFNASNVDDKLREEDCRANVMHTAPSRTMLADSLGQYLIWKRWKNWFLISGTLPEDKAYADALKRTAKRFGASIVEERSFAYDSGSRRTDGGYEQVQQQIQSFTQGAKAHDVVLVADEGQLFGEYVPYRTWEPRPVAGTAGLVATPWHPALELWGGTQFQNRFRKLANRIMRPLDYNVWLAVRAVGEAVSRKKTGDFKDVMAFMRAPGFDLAGFKGIATSFREWNGQLRQPILVATPKMLVSVSPQQGFLHQTNELDTLGIDKPETKCKAYSAK